MVRGDTHKNPNQTILLAEDDPQLRTFLRLVFETCGYSLLVAKDAEEALEIVNRSTAPVDLLVSDVQMPGMTGPELAKEIQHFRPNLHVLLISSYTQAVDQGWHFLQKPFRPNAIVGKVEEILGKHLVAKADRTAPPGE